MKLRVHVKPEHGIAHVRIVRHRWASPCDQITVAKIALTSSDIDEELADARSKAKDLCDSLNGLDRVR